MFLSFITDNKFENSPIIELKKMEGNKLIFVLNEKTNANMKKIFKSAFRLKEIEITSNQNNEFSMAIINEEGNLIPIGNNHLQIKSFINEGKNEAVIYWDPMKMEEDFESSLHIFFKVSIDLPDDLEVKQKTHKKLKEIKNYLWAQALDKFPLKNKK